MERNSLLVGAVLASLHNNDAFKAAFNGIVLGKHGCSKCVTKATALANLLAGTDDNITIVSTDKAHPIIRIGTIDIAVFTPSAKYPAYAGSIAVKDLPYGVDYVLSVDSYFNNWFLIDLVKLTTMLASKKLIPQSTSTGTQIIGHKLFVNHFTTKEDFYALQGKICKEK